MPAYANLGGNSGVASYQVVSDFGEQGILVTFKDGSNYLYTESSVGASHLQSMVMLAKFGQGLNSFIDRVVYRNYARKY